MKKIIFLPVIVALLTGCATKQKAPSYNYGTKSELPYAGLSDEKQKQQDDKRFIVYDAYLQLIIKDADTVNRHLAAIAKKYRGYVQTIGTKATTIRVVADSLNYAITDISKLGKIDHKTIRGDDVTDQYKDFQIRLDNAERARKRYLELLEKAQNVDEALKVEKELERLNGDIELLKGKINRLNHLTLYSTITVNFKEKIKPGILGYVFIGVYKTVKWLFIRN
ncbi:MAG: DUF4349 domain-containing protein [Bacteroidia bacterium]|nr:DUF4349 domain-containing protein [Bacteroidia bacterium]